MLVFTHGWNISEPEVRGNMVKDLKPRAFEREIIRLEPQVVDKNRSDVPLDIGLLRILMRPSVINIPQCDEWSFNIIDGAVREEI